MPYNITFIDNSSGPLVLFQGVNDNSGSWFAGAFLIFLFLILMVSFNKKGTTDAFLASSFITAILAGLAFGFEILPGYALVFPISILVISLFVKIFGDG